ncbi:hypothetical protein Q5H93_07555 [Hymenobacter sp. ASUV-10]|uniref:T9SS type A sorting domain-containing protein n=1 Tax=Hymenobacter aranciens TaxID=3063996 RepID=A0ABT9BAA5_9BACT|nr:hypothetical protein [Hymenobacter sp. ASUV-10]MDO7874583.1 hypothetical protein [Hymenobacter sp. ASUV-10]
MVAAEVGGTSSFAIRQDGTLWAWGSNAQGQLGTGNTTSSSLPIATGLSNIIAISNSDQTSFALRNDGRVYSWGSNGSGILGLGAGITQVNTPTLIPGLTNVRQIDASNTTGKAVTSSGAVYCWGSQAFGQVGNGIVSISALQYTPVQLTSITGAVAVASCVVASIAILANGDTRVWGDNSSGQFGICSSSDSSVPIPGPSFMAGVEIVGTGWLLTSIEPNGVVKTWGGHPVYLGGYTPTSTMPSGYSCAPTPVPNACLAKPNAWPPCAPVAIATPNGTSTCAGRTIHLVASGGDGMTYTWSPATGLSSTTGQMVTAFVTNNITYTVSSCGQSASVDVVPEYNCCLRDANPDAYEVPPGTYDDNSNPFIYGPQATYYLPGTVRLEYGTFFLEEGVTVLVDSDTTSYIELGPEAQLEMSGATITAACQNMWGGIKVEADAIGIMSYADQNENPSSIQHSFHGIVLQEATATPAYFGLSQTSFWCNRQSIKIHRYNLPATPTDYVQGCTFDSNPLDFKAPWEHQDAENHYYSLRHIAVAGDLRDATITENSFSHSLYSVYGLTNDLEESALRLSNCRFDDFYLAGIANYHGGTNNTYLVTGSTFTFPNTGSFLPPTEQINEAIAHQNELFNQTGGPYNLPFGQEVFHEGTYGIFTHRVGLTALDNRFQQLDSVSVDMDNYDLFMSTRPRQTGILTATPATTNGNSFYLLDTGLNFQEIYQNTHYTVQGNGFTHCRIGVNLQSTSGGHPTLPDAVVNLSCNTFRRMDGVRGGTTIGVRIAYAQMFDVPQHMCTYCPVVYFYAGIRLDDPAATPNDTYMKNWFDDSNVASGHAYYSLQNEQPGYTLRYKTFGNNNFPVNSYALHDANLSYGSTNIPTGGALPNTLGMPETYTCQNQIPAWPGAGIQFRGANSPTQPTTGGGNSLDQNWPNPATGVTSFAYQLRNGTQQADLLIRRATDGGEIQRTPLNVRATSHDINVSKWTPGTYFVTLTIDGVPGPTRRVVVQ